jgi:Uma2 family endonuclease
VSALTRAIGKSQTIVVFQKLYNYRVSGRIVIRTTTEDGTEQGRHPDITVVDKQVWEAQPMAYAALVEPPQMVVEVVSTNWEDDYVDKLDEYQRLGISEYWIVDYMAIASDALSLPKGRSYLGKPKEPTIFVFSLDKNGTYQMKPYRKSECIVCPHLFRIINNRGKLHRSVTPNPTCVLKTPSG